MLWSWAPASQALSPLRHSLQSMQTASTSEPQVLLESFEVSHQPSETFKLQVVISLVCTIVRDLLR